METGVVDDDAVHPLVHEAHEVARLRLDEIPASTIGQARGDSTASTRPSPADVSRESRRLKINEHGSLRVTSTPRSRTQVHLEKKGRNSVKRRSGP
jgi:hypothetical protein